MTSDLGCVSEYEANILQTYLECHDFLPRRRPPFISEIPVSKVPKFYHSKFMPGDLLLYRGKARQLPFKELQKLEPELPEGALPQNPYENRFCADCLLGGLAGPVICLLYFGAK